MKEELTNKKEGNILILSEIPPCKNYDIGVMLSYMVKVLLEEKKNIFSYSIIDQYLNPIYDLDIKNDIEMRTILKPEIDDTDLTNKQLKEYDKNIKKIEKEIIKYIRQNNITTIWCSLQSQVLAKILNKVYNRVEIPYVLHLLNSKELEMKEPKINEKKIKKGLDTYGDLIKNSKKCITDTVTNADKYNKMLGGNYVIGMPFLKIENKNFEVLNSQDDSIIQKFKKDFLGILDIKYNSKKKLNILEVNNIDLQGRRFNGYDLQQEINKNTIHRAKQIVTYKESEDKNVIKFYDIMEKISAEVRLIEEEENELSVHSQLSITSNILRDNDTYKNSDLVHYHLIHNTKLSLYQMIELCENKPSVLTIHDPWNFTGRCVHPQECQKWKNGCHNCEYLDNLFSLKEDNCHSLWELKKKVYRNLDVDIVVTTPFMKQMLEDSPLTKHFKNVHVIPFGVDLEKFNNRISQEEARNNLGIPQEHIVLFFRAQMAMKGTEYIVEALKKLDVKEDITLVTCSAPGLLEDLKDKYNIVELGNIRDEKMVEAFNACDIFLMPSRGESFGLMAIEAMACSRPIVIFDNTALPSVTFAPECGVLVENKNSTKLMQAIEMLINNPEERIRRGRLGRELAEKHYDIRHYHKKIMQMYEKAYNRQKNKQVTFRSDSIDYDLKDVQLLIKKLTKIYEKVFVGEKLQADFLKYDKDIVIEDNYKIDYSNESVQNLIKLFNESAYRRVLQYKEEDSYFNYYKKKNKFSKAIYLLKNNRQELLQRIRGRLECNKCMYIVARTFYRMARGIKNFICGDKYKRLENRVNLLEEQITDLNCRLKVQEEKVQYRRNDCD